MKVFVTRKIPDLDVLVNRKDIELRIHGEDRPCTLQELQDGFEWADAVICQLVDKVDVALLERSAPISVIAQYAVGYNNIDVKAATRLGIRVCNTPGVLTDTTADLTLSLLLATARRIVESDAFMRTGQYSCWAPQLLLGTDLTHKVIGIVGLGRIGLEVAHRCAAFKMKVIYHDVEEKDYAPNWEFFASLDDLLVQCDFLTLHPFLSPQTTHLIGSREFELMKNSAILINASRGAVVDEVALVDALRSGKIRAAGLDVYEREPTVAPGLSELSNVVMVPHIGSATFETRTKMAIMAIGNVIATLEGTPLISCVNLPPALNKNLISLGTEPAFEVGDEARKLEAQGETIYPFHLGDFDTPCPGFLKCAVAEAIENGHTNYTSYYGAKETREAVAAHITSTRGVLYSFDQVAITPGGKPVIGKFLAAVMTSGDQVLYPSPGYPIYQSQIEFQGGVAVPYRYIERDGAFHLDLKYMKSCISDKTRILIFNNHQNPTGHVADKAEREALADICIEHNLWVLSDEAYFDIVYDTHKAASLVEIEGMKERTVILFTTSKSWAMTGWRVGAAVGPTRVIDVIAKLNANEEACTTHFAQIAAIAALTLPEGLQFQRKLLEMLSRRRDVLCMRLNAIPLIRCFTPPSTFYVFANVTALMSHLNLPDIEDLRKQILLATGISLCTRDHFGRRLDSETNFYVRLCFSGISEELINRGMDALETWVKKMLL